MNSAMGPILKKILLKSVLVGPMNSARDPHKKTQTHMSAIFNAIQTYTYFTFKLIFWYYLWA